MTVARAKRAERGTQHDRLRARGTRRCQLARDGRQLRVQDTIVKAWDQNLHPTVWDQLATHVIHDVANCLDRKLARLSEVCGGRDYSSGEKGWVMHQQSLCIEVDLSD